jgi:nonribosomal peptide synthetase DhbF
MSELEVRKLDVAEVVRRRWCEVLGLAHADSDDDFFDLGGHSLLAFRLTDALRDDLGVRIPVSALFEATTLGNYQRQIADLARHV